MSRHCLLRCAVPRGACAILATQSGWLAHLSDEIIVFNCAQLSLSLSFSFSCTVHTPLSRRRVLYALWPALYGTGLCSASIWSSVHSTRLLARAQGISAIWIYCFNHWICMAYHLEDTQAHRHTAAWHASRPGIHSHRQAQRALICIESSNQTGINRADGAPVILAQTESSNSSGQCLNHPTLPILHSCELSAVSQLGQLPSCRNAFRSAMLVSHSSCCTFDRSILHYGHRQIGIATLFAWRHSSY